MSKLIRVRDVMTNRFVTIDGVATVKEALQLMLKDEGTTVIVNKRDENDEFGIVVLADIAKKVLAVDRSPDRVNVYEIMTKPTISVSPSMDVRYCSRLFLRFGISVAPVVENGEVIGKVDYKALVLYGLVELMD